MNTLNMENAELFVSTLYQIVDEKNTDKLSTLLDDNILFRIGNYDPVIGKSAVVDANAEFFQSIKSMHHIIDEVWLKDDKIVCSGEVHYVRKDETKLKIPFATILRMQNKLIADYKVYVDLSPL